MRNFSRSISLFLFLRTSENARTFTSDLENERQNLSIDSKKTEEEGKNSFVQKTASSVQRTQKSFALVSIKNSKKQQTNFTEQTERKQRKNSKKKSVGKELDTSLCCAIDLVTALT